MPQRKRHDGECLKVGVSKDACYVRFGIRTAVVAYSEPLAYRTIRGDLMILDFDAEDRVIGIELLGDKPCQKATE